MIATFKVTEVKFVTVEIDDRLNNEQLDYPDNELYDKIMDEAAKQTPARRIECECLHSAGELAKATKAETEFPF